ncbi:hypothetical protein AB0880_03860, partial [Micromonospora chersina]|uniref:hypothetical protein n=1 Tax=Micromonospora chersina TaxID=47854 RepID=UPI003456A8C3
MATAPVYPSDFRAIRQSPHLRRPHLTSRLSRRGRPSATAKLPNVEANLLPSLRNRSFDSDNQLA